MRVGTVVAYASTPAPRQQQGRPGDVPGAARVRDGRCLGLWLGDVEACLVQPGDDLLLADRLVHLYLHEFGLEVDIDLADTFDLAQLAVDRGDTVVAVDIRHVIGLEHRTLILDYVDSYTPPGHTENNTRRGAGVTSRP